MRSALILILTLFAAGAANAGDEMQTVGAVWSDFVSSLRRGDYPNAHALFSPESQATLTYAEFVAEYGPLSASLEMVLAEPESQTTSVHDDWAELAYVGTHAATGRKFKVGVALAKNAGGWGLVAARNEDAEKMEAGARGLLRLLWSARGRGGAKELVAELNTAHAGNPVLGFYRIETDGQAVRAFPLRRGLRTFFLDHLGLVRSLEQAGATAGRPAPATELRIPERALAASETPPPLPEPKPPVDAQGMPELSEPPPRGGAGAMSGPGGEIPEPPPAARGGSRWRERPNPALPDSIK